MDSPDGMTDKCFIFDGHNWNAAQTLPTPIAEAGFTSHPEWGLVMTGGEVTDDGSVYTKSVVQIKGAGIDPKLLPDLLEALRPGCLVALDEKRLFLGGGHLNGNSISRKVMLVLINYIEKFLLNHHEN